ncbi:aminoglycoside phosphotransferase family protein [Streptomyces sp. NBC_01304]|uniref:aminoglycoside phosphotransferase family protein n=1 Tax=Streptomyces sp. NBC_01304 TaxID=2903818 RepID=UPI002E0E1465|nr:aminoglycoside phosphotransferase family protein [Streptomyces sp. NBC_01304]
MAFEPPQRLVRALGESPDVDSSGWLDRLPELAEAAALRGELSVERVHEPGGRSSLVALVRQADDAPAVLKLAPPAARPDLEAAALAHWDGWGACRLLSASDGFLVLERLHPEVSLRALPEAKALLEAAGTVRRLWVEPPAGHGFESVAARTERRGSAMASADASVRPLVDAALAARAELVASPDAEVVLLHGEFGQGKVLAGDRTPWLTVGPSPVVGERAYDLGRLALDRLDDLVASSSGAGTARRRVSKLADSLEVDRDRARGWTLFRAVDSGTRALRAGRRRQAEVLLEFASWL